MRAPGLSRDARRKLDSTCYLGSDATRIPYITGISTRETSPRSGTSLVYVFQLTVSSRLAGTTLLGFGFLNGLENVVARLEVGKGAARHTVVKARLHRFINLVAVGNVTGVFNQLAVIG